MFNLDGLQLHIETLWEETHLKLRKLFRPSIPQPTNYDPLSVEGHQEISEYS